MVEDFSIPASIHAQVSHVIRDFYKGMSYASIQSKSGCSTIGGVPSKLQNIYQSKKQHKQEHIASAPNV